MAKEETLEQIIEGYRNTIHERYQYQKLKNAYEVPVSINEATVNRLRTYFLEYIYPEFDKRKELNDAFASLDDYSKRPEKLLRILMESVKIIVKYGRHLPKVLNAGLKALTSFRAATEFENKLVAQAIKRKIAAPYDQSKLNRLIGFLSRQEIERFIESVQSLFEILHDRVLVGKIKEMLHYLITKMREKPKLYSVDEVRGLEIGMEMLNKGDALFEQLTKEDQQNLIHLVIKIERDVLDEIFQEK